MKKSMLIFVLVFLAFFVKTSYAIDFYLVTQNNTLIDMLKYDRVNSTLGSFSYKDNSIVNPNVYLLVCGINSSYINDTVNLLYSSESTNITIDLLSIDPTIYSIENISIGNKSLSCGKLDIDISAFRALYPAIPFVGLYELKEYNKTVNTTNITVKKLEPIVVKKINQTLNGSYLLGIDIDDIAKKTFLTPMKIFDNNHTEITNATKGYLILSIVKGNQSVAEGVTAPKKPLAFNYMFSDNETVYVNGIPSLRVKVVPPCSKINETGYYYVLNKSAWNINNSCLVVENTSNIVVDFANKTIDGDNNVNGSLSKNKCAITVKDAENITLKGVKAQQFYYGICIIDSKNIKVSGSSDQANVKGIYVKNATAKIARIKMNNSDAEIVSEDNGIVDLHEAYLATSNLTTKAKDVIIKNVFNPPKDPKGLVNISQWVNVSKNGNSWLANITFHFIFPNPQGILPKVIYKFDGVYVNGTWQNETWEALHPSYVDVANRYIVAPLNLTSFSIFVPYGEYVNVTKPKPTPTPTPTRAPSAVAGKEEKAVPPRLNLTLHTHEITMQQGEIKEIGFNLTNEGDADVYNTMVLPVIRKGWMTAPVHFDVVRAGETKVSKFYLKVYDNEIPGTYYVPVRAMLEKNNVTVDVDILKVTVVPRQRVAKIDILEILPYLVLPEHSAEPISVLVENTGDYDLHNLTLSIEGASKCIEKVDGSYNLKRGEKKSLTFVLHTKKAGRKCRGVYIFRSKEGIVGMYPVIIKIRPRKFIHGILIYPIIYISWTLVTIITIYRRLKKVG